ncbi:hypothetical protein [Flammeovirga sp. EKP202]|uniref:hypothetical protein n=1 Tax=Flammeovirga sp. EKP202 TaxID=2770592 RepID=UPI00165F3294|nr:hypothetical protein [Flammeovirga sp. EKP202]MBD0404354.1 hypothetical protein [Flammeovirga sp. EKP202]
MLLETTFGKTVRYHQSRGIVGKKFSLIKILKLGGSTSPRFYIRSSNLNIGFDVESQSELDSAIIELREKGVLIHINVKVRNFEWIIPYYRLVLYHTDKVLSLHSQGFFLQFEQKKTSRQHTDFVKKLIDQKQDFRSDFSFIDDL